MAEPEYLRPPAVLTGPVALVDYDDAWPAAFVAVARRIRDALGRRALVMEHVGSTSVPGLVAKPVIDVLLLVEDPADEGSYVPALEDAGFVLYLREPAWHGHRLLKGSRPDVNLHVLQVGCDEAERMLVFRDRLRTHDAERDLYAAAKTELAARTWTHLQDYADAKTDVVRGILARAPGGTAPMSCRRTSHADVDREAE